MRRGRGGARRRSPVPDAARVCADRRSPAGAIGREGRVFDRGPNKGMMSAFRGSSIMLVSLVVTVIGEDRPGLVSLLSDRAMACGANWAESRMANLAGQFAGIVHFQVPSENAKALAAALRELETQGLRVLIAKSEARRASAVLRRLKLDLVGHDRPESFATSRARSPIAASASRSCTRRSRAARCRANPCSRRMRCSSPRRRARRGELRRGPRGAGQRVDGRRHARRDRWHLRRRRTGPPARKRA